MAAHPAAVLLEQLLQRDGHDLLDIARPLDVAADAHQLGARVVGPAEAREPLGAAANDVRHHRDRLDIVDRGRAAVEPRARRERRLQPRLALLALQAFQQRRLFTADVGAGAVVDVHLEVPAVDVAGADQARASGLGHRRLQHLALADVLAADVDVANVRLHGEGRDQAAFDEQVRIVPQDLAVLAGAGLGLVRVDHQVVRPVLHLLGHEGPLQPRAEAGAPAAAQA
jgi:hypothetical protein